MKTTTGCQLKLQISLQNIKLEAISVLSVFTAVQVFKKRKNCRHPSYQPASLTFWLICLFLELRENMPAYGNWTRTVNEKSHSRGIRAHSYAIPRSGAGFYTNTNCPIITLTLMNEWEALLPDESTPPRCISANDIIAKMYTFSSFER